MIPRLNFAITNNKSFECFCLICVACIRNVLCVTDSPRLTLKQDRTLGYKKSYNHTVSYHHEKSSSLFIGGTNAVLHIDLAIFKLQNITLSPDLLSSSKDITVTVIDQFQNSTFICGTNGEQQQCWNLNLENSGQPFQLMDINDERDLKGISPFTITQDPVLLVADGDLYSAAPLYTDGTYLQFRRIGGNRQKLWMYDQWISEPTFISSFLAERKEDPIEEKIYVFFRERNSDTSPEADRWISRVARVCKVDEGGPKQELQSVWTTFLKARLVCGMPRDSVYFNRLQDVFVQHNADWRKSRVYALFTSSWNSTAVCVYSLEDLDGVFDNSSFNSYDGSIPSPRPGSCNLHSKNVSLNTLRIVKYYPEMNNWIYPIIKEMPFYTSTRKFTKMVVDQIKASDGETKNVVLLATDNGVIFKILESSLSEGFIISETHLYGGTVQFLKLDSEKRKLFVGYPNKMSVLDLQNCQDYNNSCPDCVLSRDPYCAWSEQGCTSETRGGVQNLVNGSTFVCNQKQEGRTRREVLPSTVPLELYVVNDVPVYLSCPVDSHHATYKWQHGSKSEQCQQSQTDCLHLIPAMTEEDYGNYKCIFQEQDYVRTVVSFDLVPKSVNSAAFRRRDHNWLLVLLVSSLLCWHSL